MPSGERRQFLEMGWPSEWRVSIRGVQTHRSTAARGFGEQAREQWQKAHHGAGISTHWGAAAGFSANTSTIRSQLSDYTGGPVEEGRADSRKALVAFTEPESEL